MDPKITLSLQPVQVLVALFRTMKYKVLENGQVNPKAVQILQLLQSKGYRVKDLL
tara:strand:+ start:751 stop:915 length:165 start_codon:yes stop_codon:yes gene_type:complete